MSVGRPRTSDSPEKYRTARELHQLSSPPLPRGASAADEISAFLEWAISEQREGFREGDIINIGSLAKGLGKSRNTAAKGVERLISMGMVTKGKEKSPYLITSAQPIFRDLSLVADEQISLTYKMESESHFGEIISFDAATGTAGYRAFLQAELARCRDPLVQEARSEAWSSGRIQLFQRLRTVEHAGRVQGCLAELTYIRLDEARADQLRAKVSELRRQEFRRGSLYDVLSQCGVRDVRAGRTHVTVGTPPPFLPAVLGDLVGGKEIDVTPFTTGAPMLEWSYGLFRPDREPLLSFSVCFVHTDLLSVFIRKMDIELAPDNGGSTQEP